MIDFIFIFSFPILFILNTTYIVPQTVMFQGTGSQPVGHNQPI